MHKSTAGQQVCLLQQIDSFNNTATITVQKNPQNCSLYFFFKPWVRNVIPCQWDLWDTLMYHSSFCRFPSFVKVLTLSTSACWKCNKEKKKMIIIIFINFFILHYTGKKPTETDPVWSCSQDKSNFLKKKQNNKTQQQQQKAGLASFYVASSWL